MTHALVGLMEVLVMVKFAFYGASHTMYTHIVRGVISSLFSFKQTNTTERPTNPINQHNNTFRE